MNLRLILIVTSLSLILGCLIEASSYSQVHQNQVSPNQLEQNIEQILGSTLTNYKADLKTIITQQDYNDLKDPDQAIQFEQDIYLKCLTSCVKRFNQMTGQINDLAGQTILKPITVQNPLMPEIFGYKTIYWFAYTQPVFIEKNEIRLNLSLTNMIVGQKADPVIPANPGELNLLPMQEIWLESINSALEFDRYSFLTSDRKFAVHILDGYRSSGKKVYQDIISKPGPVLLNAKEKRFRNFFIKQYSKIIKQGESAFADNYTLEMVNINRAILFQNSADLQVVAHPNTESEVLINARGYLRGLCQPWLQRPILTALLADRTEDVKAKQAHFTMVVRLLGEFWPQPLTQKDAFERIIGAKSELLSQTAKTALTQTLKRLKSVPSGSINKPIG